MTTLFCRSRNNYLNINELYIQRRKQYVEAMTLSILENLLASNCAEYSNDDDNRFKIDDNLELRNQVTTIWVAEMCDFIRQRSTLFDLKMSSCEDVDGGDKVLKAIVQEAMATAWERWKTNRSSTQSMLPPLLNMGNTSKVFPSFSIFGSQILLSIVTWDVIEAAESEAERLELIQKIQHIDDILPDWESVFTFLSKRLMKEKYSDESLCNIYLDLYKKWLKQSQSVTAYYSSCSEYHSLQIDLCRSLLQFVETSSHPISSTLLKHALTLVHSTWMFWTVRLQGAIFGRQDMDAVFSIGMQLWNWTVSDQSDCCDSLSCVWKQMDPYARWFNAWIQTPSTHYLTPAQTLALLLLPRQHMPNSTVVAFLVSSIVAMQRNVSLSHVKSCNCVSQTNYLSLLACALRVLRVESFPWKYLVSTSDDSFEPSFLFNLDFVVLTFFDAYTKQQRLLEEDGEHCYVIKNVCREVIDIILSGCKGLPIEVSLINKIRE